MAFDLPALLAQIPVTWQTPGNPDTRVRVFRIEIENAYGQDPRNNFHMAEAIEVGSSRFEAHAPQFSMQAGMSELFADPVLGEIAQVAAGCMRVISYELYKRKKAEIEAALAPTPQE